MPRASLLPASSLDQSAGSTTELRHAGRSVLLSAAVATATGDGLPFVWSWPAGGASCDAWRFVDVGDYKPHHEFELREVHVKWTQSSYGGGGASYPYVSLTFDLQRAALSYVYAVLLPLLL